MYSRSGRDTPASVASAASLWSVPPSFRRNEVTVIPDSTQEEQKPLSDGKMLMKISIYSLSVTTASIFYFPEAAYKHGGAVLFIILLHMQRKQRYNIQIMQFHYRILRTSLHDLNGSVCPAARILRASAWPTIWSERPGWTAKRTFWCSFQGFERMCHATNLC